MPVTIKRGQTAVPVFLSLIHIPRKPSDYRIFLLKIFKNYVKTIAIYPAAGYNITIKIWRRLIAVINILTCDDEAVFLDIIQDAIKKEMSGSGERYEFYGFTSGRELIKRVIEKEEIVPHIIFMDVMMPDLNGKDTAYQVKKKFPDCQIVLISSHEEESFDSFDYNVNGFISKYKLNEKFSQNFQRVMGNIRSSRPSAVCLTVFGEGAGFERIRLSADDIIFLECDDKRAFVILESGEKIRIKCDMWRSVNADFDKPPFAVPHRNYIVNMNHISRITSEDVIMSDGTAISLSKRRRSDFVKKYTEYSVKSGGI